MKKWKSVLFYAVATAAVLAGVWLSVLLEGRAEAQVTVSQVWLSDFVQCSPEENSVCGLPAWYPRLYLSLAESGEPFTATKLFDGDNEDHVFAVYEVTADLQLLRDLHNEFGHRIDTDLTDAQTEIRSKPQFGGLRAYMQGRYNDWQQQGCVLPPDPVDLLIQPQVCP